MRILMIGKYPPIEGGVSAGDYWLARGLGERGVSVTVLTNALGAEEEHRIFFDPSDPAVMREWEPPSVEVRQLKKHLPAHIPYSPAYVSRLAGAALAELGDRPFDAVYARYLEPYGTAALLVKFLTGTPYVLRHAGSDMYRLLPDLELRYVLGRVLSEANAVFLSPGLRHLASGFGIKNAALRDLRRSMHPAFSPEGDGYDLSRWDLYPTGAPVLLYLGKASERKSLLETIDALAEVRHDFLCILVTQGALVAKLRERIAERGLQGKVVIRDFVPPWKVPSLLRAADFALHLEHGFPIPIHTPAQPLEAIACGTPLILSGEMYAKIRGLYPEQQAFTVVEDPTNPALLRERLFEAIGNAAEKKKHARALLERPVLQPWADHIDAHLTLFEELSKGR